MAAVSSTISQRSFQTREKLMYSRMNPPIHAAWLRVMRKKV